MALRHTQEIDSIFAARKPDQIGLGRILLEQGHIVTWQFFFSITKGRLWNVPATDIMRARGWVKESEIRAAWSEHLGCPIVDLRAAPPDPGLSHIIASEDAIRLRVIPWVRINGQLVIATDRPENYETLRHLLPACDGNVLIAIASEKEISENLKRAHNERLLSACETRLGALETCRNWQDKRLMHALTFLCLLGALLLFTVAYPGVLLFSLLLLALFTQFCSTALKSVAFFASRNWARKSNMQMAEHTQPLPRISVLVPLYKENEIANALIRRLSCLTYPRALLEVLLVLEEKDHLTAETLANTKLPDWMKVIVVPCHGTLTTKPRAMNYALDFCSGDIIGIWDAEDAPAPDQLEAIAHHFAQAEADVACVQGVLDYYNPYTNWISRCFTLEYSIWFRIVLRGLSQLRIPIPLGGTTLFFRRNILEDIGRWDAHNVTEDADLGIRLSRYGYRTELSHTVTQEEANCGLLPWVQQRSRWLKGYMVTYLVHMRRPLALWKDLGPRQFIGFNILFLTTILNFPLAPLIWSFWLMVFGISDPLGVGLYPAGMTLAIGLFLTVATALDILIACFAIRGQKRNRLLPWSLCFNFYYPLATLAAYKAIYEMIFHPFYWDKTQHGKTTEGKNATYSAIRT